MRRFVSCLALAFLALGSTAALARTDAEVTSGVTVITNDQLGLATSPSVQCALNSVPTGFFAIAKHPDKVIEITHRPVDALGQPIDLANITNGTVLNGAGFQFGIVRIDPTSAPERLTAGVLCIDLDIVDGGTSLQLVSTTRLVQPGEKANITRFCDAGSAIGSLNNAGDPWFLDFGSAPVWGTPVAPLYLGNLPDGTMGAPLGWELTVQNFDRAAHPVTQVMMCGLVPNLTTLISSVPTVPAKDFTLSSIVPDTHRFVNYGFDGGLYGAPLTESFAWFRNGRANYEDLFNPGITANPGVARIDRGIAEFITHGLDMRTQNGKSAGKASARAVLATLIVARPDAPPPATVVTIVEFYNGTLNHFFITANAQEITDLDTGVHPGWQRTGQTFKAYGVGSTGRTGRQPVCRAYGNPSAGLDSHFYSASLDECFSTLSRFDGIWLLEAAEVFEMDLPDPITGACPAGDVPIYRVFNNRRDVNHRYTSSRAIRDQMVASGFIAEGYGPDTVTLCGLP